MSNVRLQNGTTKVNKRTKKNVCCNTRGLVEQGVLGIVIGVVIGSFQFVANSLLCPPRAVGVALCDTAIRPSVCPSSRRAAAVRYRHAGCLQLSRVRSADPSADGRRSAASRTAIGGDMSSLVVFSFFVV